MSSDPLTKIVFRSRVPASAADVYRWHAQPETFARLQPPWGKAEVIERTGGIEDLGSRFTIRLKIGPFKQDWITEHIAFETGRMFEDIMISGPFHSWDHTHAFLQDPSDPHSSWLEDRIKYELPLGWLGKYVAGSWTHKRLRRIFAWRHRVTIEAFASPAKIGKDEGSDVPLETY
jgi:ligand-binding SRPBCC domain-containing protein